MRFQKCVSVLLFAFGFFGALMARAAPLNTGDSAPDFPLRTADETVVRLSDFRGKVVVLDFWATWCAPCIASFPHTQELARRYGNQGVVVLAAGTSDKSEKFREWFMEHRGRFPDILFGFDENERGSATFEERASEKLYRVGGLPTQFVIDRDGKVVGLVDGFSGESDRRTEYLLSVAGIAVPEPDKESGAAQQARSEVERRTRAEKESSTPPFVTRVNRLNRGDSTPDIALVRDSGEHVPISSVWGRGATVVVFFALEDGPEPGLFQMLNRLADSYRAQGLKCLAVGTLADTALLNRWKVASSEWNRILFLADPAGPSPKPPKPYEQMTPAESAAFKPIAQAHWDSLSFIRLTGGMAPLPSVYVFSAGGRFAGHLTRGPETWENAIKNLLLAAGINLEPNDRPSKIWPVSG